jgi:hypothetical protein
MLEAVLNKHLPEQEPLKKGNDYSILWFFNGFKGHIKSMSNKLRK